MNTKVGIKEGRNALDTFRAAHVNDRKEHAIVVDENNYVYQYIHGARHSVGIDANKLQKGQTVIHNHPSGSNFSDQDLLMTAQGKHRSVIASTKTGDYVFVKGDRFKPREFVAAMSSAKMKGSDYNDATHKWLRRNQKKYGYKYDFIKR